MFTLDIELAVSIALGRSVVFYTLYPAKCSLASIAVGWQHPALPASRELDSGNYSSSIHSHILLE